MPLLYAVQEICDRTALVTGDSLGTLVRRKFVRSARVITLGLAAALLVGVTNVQELEPPLAGLQTTMVSVNEDGSRAAWAYKEGTALWLLRTSTGGSPSTVPGAGSLGAFRGVAVCGQVLFFAIDSGVYRYSFF